MQLNKKIKRSLVIYIRMRETATKVSDMNEHLGRQLSDTSEYMKE